ncbi:hypothetical protein E2C01_087907 [Portunus trituberculatus]|uniref:Uncharacterized protein n=1 Tax=Portunus trituberculatus TaxID=210409 RepID=A0A5B7JD36_PORTR|nr:hypothetical protein [Portunus trituberculatus]
MLCGARRRPSCYGIKK